jgi:uncharacterized protein YqjF (DUF2071 family)
MENHDFNDAILDETAHRPWRMPGAPWIMTQTWHDLLFAHWPVDKVALAAMLPDAIALDLFDGEAWVGIVPFRMTNVAPRGVPSLPWVSAFPELNVRTYVRAGGKPGVYFFSLDAGNPLAVAAARAMFHLPYYLATMEVEGDARDGGVSYRSRRAQIHGTQAELAASYRPIGPVSTPEPGTLEHFLTERYCLHTVEREGHALTVDIHHPPWPLQAAEAEIRVNTMADAAGIRLSSRAPVLHFARRQDVVAWAPVRSPS